MDWKNWKKIFIAVVVVVAAAAVAVGVWWNKSRAPFDPSTDPATLKSARQFEDFYNNLNEVYRKDTYGGKTPEETLQMFIDALKKGDTDLAAKYYIPEKQKQEAEELRRGKEANVLGLLIGDLEKEKIGRALYEDQYRFITVDENNTAEFQFDLLFNAQTKVWKIESL
jgi:hypothetical protein